jgi:hypothetical protein
MIKTMEFMRGALLTSLLLVGMSEPAEANANEESGICEAIYELGKQSVLARYRGASLETLLSIMREDKKGKSPNQFDSLLREVVIEAYGFEITAQDDQEHEAKKYGLYAQTVCGMMID